MITAEDVERMVERNLAKSGGARPREVLGVVSRQLGYTEAWAAELAYALQRVRDDTMTKAEMQAIADFALKGSGF